MTGERRHDRRPRDDEAHFRRLRREAKDFLEGRSDSAASLYWEMQHAVARQVLGRDELPEPDDPRRLPKPVGRGVDAFTAQGAWDLLHDYVTYHLFAPGDAKIFVVLRQGRDIAGFRRWLRIELRRYIGLRIRADESGRMRDSLLGGLDRVFRRSGLPVWGSKPDRYWSERERTPEAAADALRLLDVEGALDVALREIDEKTVTLGEDKPTRLKSGWGPAERAKMGAIIAACLSAEVPGEGRVTFIPEGPLKGMLTRLISASFPELFTQPLYVPLGDDADGDRQGQRETGGVLRVQAMDALGAVDAVLEVMEKLTRDSTAARSGGTNGSDVRRAVRLFFDGARSTRDGEAAWRAEPLETRGDRRVDVANLVECMPEGPTAQDSSELGARLKDLARALATAPPAGPPRSHVTVNSLRERCWALWSDACVDLDPVAEALALHWFIDLLFLEVGRDTPFASIDGTAIALMDRRAAERAAARALARLGTAALKPGREGLPVAVRAALEGETDETIARRLSVTAAGAARLRLAGAAILDGVWAASELLPNQRTLAEAIVLDELRRPDGQRAEQRSDAP